MRTVLEHPKNVTYAITVFTKPSHVKGTKLLLVYVSATASVAIGAIYCPYSLQVHIKTVYSETQRLTGSLVLSN